MFFPGFPSKAAHSGSQAAQRANPRHNLHDSAFAVFIAEIHHIFPQILVLKEPYKDLILQLLLHPISAGSNELFLFIGQLSGMLIAKKKMHLVHVQWFVVCPYPTVFDTVQDTPSPLYTQHLVLIDVAVQQFVDHAVSPFSPFMTFSRAATR